MNDLLADEAALALHEELVVVDGLEYHDWDDQHIDALRAGGVTCVNVTCAIWENARESLNPVSRWHRRLRERSDALTLFRSTADIDKAKASGRTAILLGFQNTDPLESDIELLEIYWQLGIRCIQLTYNTQNAVGAGCWEETDAGLSSTFGPILIREMNELGILIDLSHCNERTVLDAIAASSRPVAITHGNPSSFVGDGVELAKRNRSDGVLRELAAAGGLIGLSMYPKIAPDGPDCTLERFCEMAAYTCELVGVEHVGVGTDFCSGWPREQFLAWRSGKWSRAALVPLSHSTFPEWMRDASCFPNLTAGLLAKGFSTDEVRLIMGENFRRVLRQAVDAAQTAIAGGE